MNVQATPFPELTATKKIKRIIVAVVGGTVLALGLALLVLPGPAFLVIPAGLAILAMEFAWARRWLRKARGLLTKAKPRRNQQTASSYAPLYYRRAKAADSCRNTIRSTQIENAASTNRP
jgi:tellurite resistance protein TerC